ncbi:hypothetical protein [Luteolibacter sp. LG18]|uniref:hypothetical protein n=1 Tax=Luteolibacter sp. LG18 TaxID=2819286 RepID=UPI002B2A3237|nr:hypothetical protein llg_22460 [Luteolibacter sp. LG18]
MMEPTESLKRWDALGTVISALILAGGGLLMAFGVWVVGKCKEMFAEVGLEGLPWFTRSVYFLQKVHVLELAAVLLLGLGVVALAVVPERPRANLYGGLVGVLLALCGAATLATSMIPLVYIINTFGQQS